MRFCCIFFPVSLDGIQFARIMLPMISAEVIKTWLKKIGKDRKWLAGKTLVDKRTVDSWLSSGKKIPSAKLDLIARLMRAEEEIPFELPADFESWLREEADKAKTSIDAIVNRVLADIVNELNKHKAP